MNIRVIQIGKTGKDFLVEGEAEYSKRLKRYVRIDIISLPDIKPTKRSEKEIKAIEASKILDKIDSKDYVVVLDEHGTQYRSVEFASWFQNKMNTGISVITFVIGGPYGFDSLVYERANEKLALSKFTFSHQMTRMIFLEQVYRAMTIIKREPYHHE